MNRGIYSIASALTSAERRLEVISNNLANLSTPAFKRRTATQALFEVPARRGAQEVLVTGARIDQAQGDLDRTGNPFDLALLGEGWFAVESDRGQVYTRDGSFRLTEDGVLTTADGLPVAWARRSGALDPRGEAVTVSTAGVVHQGSRRVGELRIANFADPSRLRPNGDGYFEAPAGLKEINHTAEVHQGALEASNAAGMTELIDLILVQRQFQAATNVTSMIQASYQRLARPN